MSRSVAILHRRVNSIRCSPFVIGLLLGLLTACSSPVATPTLGPTESAAGSVLKIYTPPDQFAPEVLEAFAQKHNAKVTLATYRDETELNTEIESGPIDYDLVLIDGYQIPPLRTGDRLEPLNKDNIPNINLLSPEFQNSHFDPGNRYCVPYQWSMLGIGYNPNLTGHSLTSWRDVFSYTQQLAWALPDSSRITLGAVLLALGSSPNTTEAARLQQVQATLAAHASQLITYTAQPARQLLTGQAAVAIDRLGSLIQASQHNPALQYVFPQEGSLRVTEFVCLMKDAPNAALAEQFINDLLEPSNGLAAIRFTGQSSPNQAVVDQLPDNERADPLKYPAADSQPRNRLYLLTELAPETLRLYSTIWNQIHPRPTTP